ncbi:MAG: HNH endonuclease signature motif containing protein [Nanoarchaeota archaeon]
MRQLIKNDVPEEWKKRAKAGLCPVCAKSKIEFAKGMIVYCSVKCRNDYISKYEFWNNLRDKILKRDNYTCKNCGINDENAKKFWKESTEELFKDFCAKEKKEFEAFRNKELEILSKRYEEEYNEIMNDLLLFKRIRYSISHQFEKDYPIIFSYSWRTPAFQVDHIKAIMNNGDMWDSNNLQTLCEDCHKTKTKEDFAEKKNINSVKKI